MTASRDHARAMSTPAAPVHEQVKKLLQLPPEAQPQDVFECIVGCLTDALHYELQSSARIPGRAERYEAAWLGPDGIRYAAVGRSERDAALAAALRLIAESEEAQLLRNYNEPEMVELASRGKRKARRAASSGQQLRGH
jgi:hypothetical protein